MGAFDAAIECKQLWFSYEVAGNISATAKTLEPQKTHDGGLSVDMPRRQYESGTQATYQLQLKDVSLALPAGSRTLLLGANGAGKSTLMSVVGGKHMVEKDKARVLGRPAFHDTSLSTEVSLLTGNWTHTVAFVGHNVPYQAMEVSRLIESHSTNVDPSRVQRLVSLLEVNPDWNLTTVSDGQRRRVQILCKLLKPTSVLLLDEITTDLDLLARQDLLGFLREESEQRGVTIVYCTHIFDGTRLTAGYSHACASVLSSGLLALTTHRLPSHLYAAGLDGWPTHIAYVNKGELEFCKPVGELASELAIAPEQASKGWGMLFCAVQRMLLKLSPEFLSMISSRGDMPSAPPVQSDAPPAVAISQLHWGYPGARGTALNGVDLRIERGTRCLLVGANGAGKTTLLKLIGGKNMVMNGSLKVLGREAFGDTQLNTMVSLLSGDWTRQVACVGSGVPFQADFSVGFMADSLVEALIRDGMDETLVRSRLERLSQLLALDYEWRLHKVSDGQRRRAQLLLKLLRPSELLLLDEVTTDLDVLSRQALLQFLREETELRGATVVYSTHIFDGLDDWPTHMIRMQQGTVTYIGKAQLAPEAAPTSGASGSLFQTVRGWLDTEREARKVEPMDMDGPSGSAQALPVPAKPTNTSFASKFDRFGGASRQSMYAR